MDCRVIRASSTSLPRPLVNTTFAEDLSVHGLDEWLLTRRVLSDCRNKDSGVEGFPLRSWSIEIYLVNDHGEQVPANVFDKVTYHLHPSFGDRATQGMLFFVC